MEIKKINIWWTSLAESNQWMLNLSTDAKLMNEVL